MTMQGRGVKKLVVVDLLFEGTLGLDIVIMLTMFVDVKLSFMIMPIAVSLGIAVLVLEKNGYCGKLTTQIQSWR